MISERQLARGFAAKWREWAPHLHAAFLSEVGSAGGRWNQFCRTWDCPMKATGVVRYNDLIAEVAFGLFSECVGSGFGVECLGPESRAVIIRRAAARIAVLRRTQVDLEKQLNERLLAEAEQLTVRLLRHFEGWTGVPEVQPLVAGVGLVNSCHPDLVYGDAIVEIKMGVSPFRCADIRQLIIYCALLRQSAPTREFKRLTLVNPRRGVSWEFPLEALIQVIAENCVQDFFQEIIEFLCGEGANDLGFDGDGGAA